MNSPDTVQMCSCTKQLWHGFVKASLPVFQSFHGGRPVYSTAIGFGVSWQTSMAATMWWVSAAGCPVALMHLSSAEETG